MYNQGVAGCSIVYGNHPEVPQGCFEFLDSCSDVNPSFGITREGWHTHVLPVSYSVDSGGVSVACFVGNAPLGPARCFRRGPLVPCCRFWSFVFFSYVPELRPSLLILVRRSCARPCPLSFEWSEWLAFWASAPGNTLAGYHWNPRVGPR